MPEVWVRFLLALVGLVLAFAAALFSTVFRESGNLWGTLILASTALLLAVMVGLTTVPYLARRVVGGRARDAFHYEVTRIGVVYVLVIVLISVAAFNTGNNLLYIIVSVMLAAILVSGVASAWVLRDLELDLQLPESVFAHQILLGRFVLKNPRRRLPSFSVHVMAWASHKPAMQWQWVPSVFFFPPGPGRARHWLQVPDRKLRRVPKPQAHAGLFQGSIYFPFVPPGGQLTAELELHFDRRGRYQQEGFGLATRFPFAFLLKTRRVPLAREVIVYPPLLPQETWLQILPSITGEWTSFLRGQGSDLYRIREHLPEDSARYVDWKATAKSGSLKVREFSREDERKLRIIFDNPAPGEVAEADYETAVTLAASLAWHFTLANADVSFAVSGHSGEGKDVHLFLRHLALIAPAVGPSFLEELPPSDAFHLLITARPPAAFPPALRSASYFLPMQSSRAQAAPSGR
ncbi:MAG: DUF58 domain-containing protein [Acidobacteria bacterium]|nr:DUF58 domain-containing protein [Acidobacteriota bacterium]